MSNVKQAVKHKWLHLIIARICQGAAEFSGAIKLGPSPDDFAKSSASAGAIQIAKSNVTRGPLHDWLGEVAPALAARGISLCEWQRDRDRAI